MEREVYLSPITTLQVLVPILLTEEGKWFVGSCSILDIATHGSTERGKGEPRGLDP